MDIKFPFYFISNDVQNSHLNPLDLIKTAVHSGVNIVQLREKNMNTENFISLGLRIKKILEEKTIPLIINDRIEVAQILNASGVHLGQTDLSPFEARKILGKEKIIGITLERPDQLKLNEIEIIDYIAISSIYPTQTKKNVHTFWQQSEILGLKKIFKKPIIGIGGIHSRNALMALKKGIDGIAVISALSSKETLKDVSFEASKLYKIIKNFHKKRNHF